MSSMGYTWDAKYMEYSDLQNSALGTSEDLLTSFPALHFYNSTTARRSHNRDSRGVALFPRTASAGLRGIAARGLAACQINLLPLLRLPTSVTTVIWRNTP